MINTGLELHNRLLAIQKESLAAHNSMSKMTILAKDLYGLSAEMVKSLKVGNRTQLPRYITELDRLGADMVKVIDEFTGGGK